MESEARLTRLASCAGCGAKVGAGTLSKLLQDFRTRTDPRLVVGFDKSDDASVYLVNNETALIQTVDFFPPIVDDPYLFGQIAATNAISDVYAMGGEPRLALNVLCVTETTVRPGGNGFREAGGDPAERFGQARGRADSDQKTGRRDPDHGGKGRNDDGSGGDGPAVPADDAAE